MAQAPIVLVVGAGAGVEFKMPVGTSLSTQVAGHVGFHFDRSGMQRGGNHDLYQALKSANPGRENDIFAAGNVIARGIQLSQSIDDFLYNHGETEMVVTVGKAAIAHSILESERGSHLYGLCHYDPSHRDSAFATVSDSWLIKLFARLTSGVRKGAVDTIFDGLSIINFNYDRCIELLLLRALERAYALDERDAAAVLAKLDITHPYGSVGRLPWQEGSDEPVQFGDDPGGRRVVQLGRDIKTFTEQSHDDEERAHWGQIIKQAKRLAFMGFGFHKQNADLIRFGGSRPIQSPTVYATACKESESAQEVFRERINSIRGAPGGEIRMAALGCKQFMDEYGLRMMA